jgi:hypothetical protein
MSSMKMRTMLGFAGEFCPSADSRKTGLATKIAANETSRIFILKFI